MTTSTMTTCLSAVRKEGKHNEAVTLASGCLLWLLVAFRDLGWVKWRRGVIWLVGMTDDCNGLQRINWKLQETWPGGR